MRKAILAVVMLVAMVSGAGFALERSVDGIVVGEVDLFDDCEGSNISSVVECYGDE